MADPAAAKARGTLWYESKIVPGSSEMKASSCMSSNLEIAVSGVSRRRSIPSAGWLVRILVLIAVYMSLCPITPV